MSEAKVEEKKETKPEVKAEKKAEKAPAAPKEKKPKEVKVLHAKNLKAKPNSPIDPRTGTKFEPNTARQLAFDIVYKMAKEGKNVKEIREVLGKTKKTNGAAYSLDVGYLNFVVSYHPEMFQVKSDGSITILKDPAPDAVAAKKLEDEKAARKAKSEENRKKVKETKPEETKAEAKKEEKK